MSYRLSVALTASSVVLRVYVFVPQSCPSLCDPTDCSPTGSTVHGILQGRILEWVAMPFSRGSSETWVSCIAGRFSIIRATREAQLSSVQSLSRARLFATLWTAACHASLSINSQSLPKLTSIELMMPSNHLIFCCTLFLLPSIFPSISSVAYMSDSLQPHELQHTRPPCVLLSPGACSNSCPLSL